LTIVGRTGSRCSQFYYAIVSILLGPKRVTLCRNSSDIDHSASAVDRPGPPPSFGCARDRKRYEHRGATWLGHGRDGGDEHAACAVREIGDKRELSASVERI